EHAADVRRLLTAVPGKHAGLHHSDEATEAARRRSLPRRAVAGGGGLEALARDGRVAAQQRLLGARLQADRLDEQRSVVGLRHRASRARGSARGRVWRWGAAASAARSDRPAPRASLWPAAPAAAAAWAGRRRAGARWAARRRAEVSRHRAKPATAKVGARWR